MSVHTQNTHTHTHTHVSDARLVAQMPDICVYNISACVCVCLCVYVCMCVCVREIERDRERESVCVSESAIWDDGLRLLGQQSVSVSRMAILYTFHYLCRF